MDIIGIDNRGSDEAPFGYVYFGDHYRVGYTGGAAIAVFGGGDAWPEPTRGHLDAAREYLREHGTAAAAIPER